MNILYISALEGGKYTGPIYSVPNRIKGQQEFDNVYWVNLTKIENAKLFSKDFYHYISWKKFKLESLPTPFNKPDLVIFEEFFKIECCIVARKIESHGIPYIIVPRCQMTENYMKNKHLKKVVASVLLFNHFVNKSKAVQFLTEQEKIDSKDFYSRNSFVMPNGIYLQEECTKISTSPVIGTFIGRYSVWQKGLDLLLEAVKNEKELLKKNNVIFELYGPDDRTGSGESIREMVRKRGLEELIVVNGPVFDEEKKKTLLNSSFFIHTSRFEGMPMAVLDALSYGVPCLVTQGSNVREAIEDNDAGWGAENSVESIQQALVNLCNSIDTLQEKSIHAKKVAKMFSWREISKKSHEEYEKILQYNIN